MKKSIISTLGALALLGSSASFAATVTITPSAAIVNPGGTFYVTVSATGMPDIGAADLNLTFNSAAIAVLTPTTTNGMVIPAGSPFTGGAVIADNPFISGNANGIQVLAGFVTTPNGSFDALRINFQVLANPPPGALANIMITDRDGWIDANEFTPVPDVSYINNAFSVIVPVPAAGWLFVSALGGLAGLRRRFA